MNAEQAASAIKKLRRLTDDAKGIRLEIMTLLISARHDHVHERVPYSGWEQSHSTDCPYCAAYAAIGGKKFSNGAPY